MALARPPVAFVVLRPKSYGPWETRSSFPRRLGGCRLRPRALKRCARARRCVSSGVGDRRRLLKGGGLESPPLPCSQDPNRQHDSAAVGRHECGTARIQNIVGCTSLPLGISSRPSSAPIARSHLVGSATFPWRFRLPTTRALNVRARALKTATDSASPRRGGPLTPAFATCASRNSGPVPRPYSCRTYAAISPCRRGFIRSSISALPYASAIMSGCSPRRLFQAPRGAHGGPGSSPWFSRYSVGPQIVPPAGRPIRSYPENPVRVSAGASVRLTAKERILIHLADFAKYEGVAEVPPEMGQEGVAHAAAIYVQHVRQFVGPLLKEGLVRERTAHVKGHRRRLKGYDLTDRGRLVAAHLREQVRASPVRGRGPGGIQETTFGEAGRQGGGSARFP